MKKFLLILSNNGVRFMGSLIYHNIILLVYDTLKSKKFAKDINLHNKFSRNYCILH